MTDLDDVTDIAEFLVDFSVGWLDVLRCDPELFRLALDEALDGCFAEATGEDMAAAVQLLHMLDPRLHRPMLH